MIFFTGGTIHGKEQVNMGRSLDPTNETAVLAHDHQFVKILSSGRHLGGPDRALVMPALPVR